jgi:FlaA1/EpsC-like NDP-sugar epimerase
VKTIKSNDKFLLPGKLRFVGYLLLIPAAALGIIRFRYGIKPEFFEFHELAVYSVYLETKTFEIIQNNFIDETVGITLLFSLFFIAFSKEKTENEFVMTLRLKSFFIAAYSNIIFLLFSFLFIYGIGFIKILIINIYFFFIAYILVFRYFYFIKYKNEITEEPQTETHELN